MKDETPTQPPVTRVIGREASQSQPISGLERGTSSEPSALVEPESASFGVPEASSLTGELAAHDALRQGATEASQPGEVDTVSGHVAGSPGAEGNSDESKSGAKSAKKKLPVETLEQFFAYAYSRKGQPLALKLKAAREIAKGPVRYGAAQGRRRALVEQDEALSVPRQLLLAAKEMDGEPALRPLRGGIWSFVQGVMLRHPVYDERVRSAILNQDEAPTPGEALAIVMAYSPATGPNGKEPKPAQVQELRRNAVNLLAAWLAHHRGVSLEELANLLFQTVWLPASKGLSDDAARLRALTELAQPEGLGFVCERFRQQMVQARAGQEQVIGEAVQLRERIARTESELWVAQERLSALEDELTTLRKESAEALQNATLRFEQEQTQSAHEFDQVRGRVLRRLSESIEMLSVGLAALRKESPRVQVMAERAEVVIDALRNEQDQLRKE